ncbi:MAG: SseB family protein [Clostridiales bacterium]|nr:SseB family protein [Clostridiales bacterium]
MPNNTNELLDAMNQIFVLGSDVTKAPYIQNDPKTGQHQIFVFSSSSDVADFIDTKTTKHLRYLSTAVPKTEIKRMFPLFARLGVDTVVLKKDTAAQPISIPLKEFLTEEEKGIHANPALSRAAIYLAQETRQRKTDITAEALKSADQNFWEALKKSQILVAVLPPHEKIKQAKKENLQFPALRYGNGDRFIPAFTDEVELNDYNRRNNSNFQAIRVPFIQLRSIYVDGLKGFMLNPHNLIQPIFYTRLEEEMKNMK